MDHVQSMPTTEVMNNAYTITPKRSLINYTHQCLFYPSKKKLLKSIANNQFTTWTGITYAEVQKYLPSAAPTTEKVHMKRQWLGIQPTKEKVKNELDKIEYEQDINPPIVKERQNHLFFGLALIDKKYNTIFVDLTGTFPLRSVDGYTTIFILYDWTRNTILAT